MAEETLDFARLSFKTCAGCRTAKPFTEFRKDKRWEPGLATRCKKCEYAAKAIRRRTNPEQFAAHYANRKRRVAETAVSFQKPATKTCVACDLEKSIDNFWASCQVNGGISNQCKQCAGQASTRWRQRDKVHARNVIQNGIRRRRYGIDEQTFLLMLDAQGRGCAICRCELDPSSNTRKIHVDHDHATGRVRGILCHGCNSALGLLKEDVAIFAAAIRYLRRYSCDERNNDGGPAM